MPERTSVTQVTQIGKEATPGTAVAANIRLRSMGIDLSPDGAIDVFRATGSKFPALAAMGKEWAGGGVDGRATYTELGYPLSMLLGAPTTTTPALFVNARQHVWQIAPVVAQDPITYTVEKGSAVRAHRSPYLFLPEFGMDISRDSVEVNGSAMARRIEDGVSLTAAPTLVDLVPILPSQVSVYFDEDHGDLGTTKLLRVLSAGWNIGSRFGTLWPLDAAQASFVAAYEVEPSSEVTLVQEADAAGMSHLPRMRAGQTGYLRLEAVGAEIDTGVPTSAYRFTADLPVKVTDVPDFGDTDGLSTAEWGFQLFDDEAAGNAGVLTLINDIAAY